MRFLKPGLLPLRLFAKLYLTMALSTLLLISAVVFVSDYSQRKLSVISAENQQLLRDYARRSADIYWQTPDPEQRRLKLNQWIDTLRQRENTWAAIMKTESQFLAGSYDRQVFWGQKDLGTGRSVALPIHLYYSFNPVLKLPMADTGYFLMIQLPQHMRPGTYWREIEGTIQYGLPVLLVAIFALLIYRHLAKPLVLLQDATQRFSRGDYQVRTAAALGTRADELGELGRSFDQMADRIGLLVQRQRQLIQDISHELRTPITRIKLAMGCNTDDPLWQRLEREVNGMQTLLEDTLTLSWLDNEEFNAEKNFTTETLDVCLLIEALADDAQFEFPDHQLQLNLPDQYELNNSNHRALGQALENILRNALKYSPPGSTVSVTLMALENELLIRIRDQGIGIDPEYLEAMFEPFFRADKARSQAVPGYGLGLALTRRQIHAVGGRISVRLNNPQASCAADSAGLTVNVWLPG